MCEKTSRGVSQRGTNLQKKNHLLMVCASLYVCLSASATYAVSVSYSPYAVSFSCGAVAHDAYLFDNVARRLHPGMELKPDKTDPAWLMHGFSVSVCICYGSSC